MPTAFDKLKKIAKTKAAGEKQNGMPSVDAPPAIRTAIADFCDAKREMETAEGKMQNAAEIIRPEAEKLRRQRCMDDKDIHASIKLVADDAAVKAVQAARFLKMRTDDTEDLLRAACGSEEVFDEMFEIKTTYSFDEKAFMAIPDAEKVMAAVLKALGKHASLLTCESVVVPTENFVRARILNADGRALAERLEAQGLAKPIAMAISPA